MFSDPLIGNSQRISEESQSTNPVNTSYGRSAVLTQLQYINPPYPVNTPPQQFPYSETAYPQVYHPVPQQHTQTTHIQFTPSVNQPQPVTYGSAIYPFEPVQVSPQRSKMFSFVTY
uniref:Uncharacterized protein n=1 Tax=Heterorhabditis bacteriophora TaxID=37862 RepID=A0A1I7WW35_HETBA